MPANAPSILKLSPTGEMVPIQRFEVFTFPVPFKTVFRHSSASRVRAENLIVAAHSDTGYVGYGEGCPRTYVTGETISSGTAFIRQHARALAAEVANEQALRVWTDANREIIDRNPAAFCAIELALLDLFGKAGGVPVEDLLGVPRLDGVFTYSAVLGDAPFLIYRWQLHRYCKLGFNDFKIKVSGNRRRDARKMAALFNQRSAPVRVRLDANNHWASVAECVAYIKALPGKIFAIEEPLQAGDLDGFREVGEACGTYIILDESLTRWEQLSALDETDRWLINVRVSKMGGLWRSLKVAATAAERGIGVIVGAQVGETSLLTRAGLTVMNVSSNLTAAEGAFGTRLLRRDLTSKSLMFGYAGALHAAEIGATAPGLGLQVREQDLQSTPSLQT